MQINSIKLHTPNAYSFKANQDASPQKEYENPVNRKTEKNLAILSSVGGSAIAGATAFGITTCLKEGRKIPGLVGAAVAAISLALTLPSALYNTKVSSFTREKDMDVYSRKNEAQKAIYGGLNEQIADKNVPLAQNIQDYATIAMAENGKGLMVKGA